MKPKAIIEKLLLQHGVSESDFFGDSIHAHVINARRAAILALNEAGLDNPQIAKAVGRDITTVRYWLNPAQRERRIKYKTMNREKGKTHDDMRWQWATERGAILA